MFSIVLGVVAFRDRHVYTNFTMAGVHKDRDLAEHIELYTKFNLVGSMVVRTGVRPSRQSIRQNASFKLIR